MSKKPSTSFARASKKISTSKKASRVSKLDDVPETDIKLRTTESIADSIKEEMEAGAYYPEVLHGEESDEFSRPWPVLSRTYMLIMDYRQFLAARTIQRFFRGWYVRRMYLKKRKAAIAIQTEWRRFHAKRYFYELLEKTLQMRIEKFYNDMATIIQKMYRGYYVRQYVHDHRKLERMQINAAEDLLQCVAYKLHHLLRTHQIPGIYSLRNSNCLSKVEALLASFSFRQFNIQTRQLRARAEAQLEKARRVYEKAKYATNLPFSGPNLMGVCPPKCVDFFNTTDLDSKMYRILSLYENMAKTDPRLQKLRAHRKTKDGEQKVHKKGKKEKNFCEDVVESMKKWRILSPDLKIEPTIFRNPKRVEDFLTEISSIHDMMRDVRRPCHCYLKIEDIPECSKQK